MFTGLQSSVGHGPANGFGHRYSLCSNYRLPSMPQSPRNPACRWGLGPLVRSLHQGCAEARRWRHNPFIDDLIVLIAKEPRVDAAHAADGEAAAAVAPGGYEYGAFGGLSLSALYRGQPEAVDPSNRRRRHLQQPSCSRSRSGSGRCYSRHKGIDGRRRRLDGAGFVGRRSSASGTTRAAGQPRALYSYEHNDTPNVSP